MLMESFSMLHQSYGVSTCNWIVFCRDTFGVNFEGQARHDAIDLWLELCPPEKKPWAHICIWKWYERSKVIVHHNRKDKVNHVITWGNCSESALYLKSFQQGDKAASPDKNVGWGYIMLNQGITNRTPLCYYSAVIHSCCNYAFFLRNGFRTHCRSCVTLHGVCSASWEHDCYRETSKIKSRPSNPRLQGK